MKKQDRQIRLTNRELILSDFKQSYKFIFGCFIFGFCLTGLMAAYYVSIHKLILDGEILNQKLRANVLIEKIEKFTVLADQLSHSLKTQIEGPALSKQSIEKILRKSISESSEKLIYGAGIWYEPYRFNKTEKFFGPYVHRKTDATSKITLSYEWNTKAYNYHEQDWYQKGFLDTENGVYVEPYFDSGQVYITKTTAFFDSEKK